MLAIPYLGGIIILLALGLGFIFIYFSLVLLREPNIPLYMRRFFITLSLLTVVAESLLVVVLSVRANDYRLMQGELKGNSLPYL